MSAAGAPVAVPAIDNTFGALLVGTLIGAALWGISCMQAYEFYSRFPEERPSIKILVAVTWILDTIHQVLISHMTYWYLVSSFGTPTNLGLLSWSVKDMVLLSALTALVVQSFFVFRVWTLSKGNIIMTSAVGSLVLASFAVTVGYYAKARQLTLWSELPALKALSLSSNALSAGSDVVISVSMIYLLHNVKTGYARSTAAINRIILFVLTTGLVTTVCAIMSLILIIAFPLTLLYITFFLLLGRLYTSSLLATLNARRRTDGNPNSSVSFNTTTNNIDTRHTGKTNTINTNTTNGPMSIHVTSERVTDSHESAIGEYKGHRDDSESGFELSVYDRK